MQIRFESGLIAELEVSWTATTPLWDAQAASDRGVLRIELLPEVLFEHDGEPVALPSRHEVADPRLEQFGYVDQLLDLHGGAPEHGQDLDTARLVLEVICAAYRSAGLGGVEVTLPFDGDRSATPLSLWREGVALTDRRRRQPAAPSRPVDDRDPTETATKHRVMTLGR